MHSDPADWRFATGEFGKPYLADPPVGRDVRFNLSHSRSRVAVALALGAEVGVDVEALDRAERFDSGIADAYFAPDEAAALRAIDDEALRREQFLRLWTLKEAWIKATGRGLSQPLDAFSIDPDRLSIRSQYLPTAQWYLAQWRVEECQLAVAVDWPSLTSPRFIHPLLVKSPLMLNKA
jgi:4'-phosphopantetheinyl transferase